MSKVSSIIGALAFLCVMTVTATMAGPAFDSLSAAAETDEAGLAHFFDGVVPTSVSVVHTNSVKSHEPLSANWASRRAPQGVIHVPVPEPTVVNDKAAGELALGNTDGLIIERGIKKLGNITSGEELFAFFKSEGIEIKWAPLNSFSGRPDYARACPPDVCADKKVIYLSNLPEHKTLFLDSNPTFLAVAVAHELTHMADYKNIGSGVKEGTAAQLYLELNGWSTGVYVYHQLLISGIAPKPNSPGESYHVQLMRLDLAIRDYVNGGKKPVASDFQKLVKVDDLFFDEYIKKVADTRKKGILSLAGIVELTYGLGSELETLQDPGLFASKEKREQYRKCKKLEKALGRSAATYIKWRKENVDAPPPVQPPVPDDQPSHPGHTHPQHPSDDDGGSDGPVDVDPGNWHPTPGSGNATWD